MQLDNREKEGEKYNRHILSSRVLFAIIIKNNWRNTMKKTNTIFVIGTVGCIVMAIAYAAIGILGLISGTFPLGYSVEAFTTNKMGAVILFLAAAANVVSVIVTQIVYHTFDRIGLISKGTMCVGMAFVALIFVFQQSIIPIALWVLGGAFSVATLAACSEIVNPKKVEKN